MKRTLAIVLAGTVLLSLAGVAFARWGSPGAMGPGWGGHWGGGPHGPGWGMMGGPPSQGPCPMVGTQATAQITEEKAKELAQEYATKALPGYTVEKVTPFPVRHGTLTAYLIELKGPKGETETIHINPHGFVMPF